MLRQGADVLRVHELRGHMDKPLLGRVPAEYVLFLIFEALNLADRLAQHLERVGRVDLVDRQLVILHQKARSKLIKVVAAATLPVDSFGDAALLAVDDLINSRLAVCVAVLAKFDANPTAIHFLRNGNSCTAAKETVQNKVAGIAAESEYPFYKFFRLRGSKYRFRIEFLYFLLRILIVSDFCIFPDRHRGHPLFYIGKKAFYCRHIISVFSEPYPVIMYHFVKCFS